MATIKISEREVEMLANAASPIYYQRIFGEDFLKEQTSLDKMGRAERDAKDYDENEAHDSDIKALDIYKKMAFVMAMQAEHLGEEEKILKLGEVDFVKWMGTFDRTDAFEDAFVDIVELYQAQETPTAEEKKEPAPQTDR